MIIRHVLGLLFLINIQEEITPGLSKAFDVLLQGTKRYLLTQRERGSVQGYKLTSFIEAAFENRKAHPGRDSEKTVNQLLNCLDRSLNIYLDEKVKF